MMIMHDDTIDRTTDGTGLLSSMTYAQLRTYDAGSWFGTEFTGEKIPTFSEALQLAKSNGNINIVAEIKTCLLYTSDAADERSSVDLGGRRIIKKKKNIRARVRQRNN